MLGGSTRVVQLHILIATIRGRRGQERSLQSACGFQQHDGLTVFRRKVRTSRGLGELNVDAAFRSGLPPTTRLGIVNYGDREYLRLGDDRVGKLQLPTPFVQLVGVDAVGHRHTGYGGARPVTGFYCAALEFERVGSSGCHRVR